jgi:enoyl-CoA hydratase
MLDHVSKVAAQIASKSPLTIRGIKKTCLYTRDHSVIESLEQVKALNASQLYSNDLLTAMMAYMKKANPNYNDP